MAKKTRFSSKTGLLFIFCLLPSFLFCDTIILKDGTKLEGVIQSINPNSVTINYSNMNVTIAKDKIFKFDGSSKAPRPSQEFGLPRQTTFEKAEELYHGGKILQAFSLYQKALEEDPQNKDAANRIVEIGNKYASKLRSDSVPIVPMSEQDVIFSIIRRLPSTQKTSSSPGPSNESQRTVQQGPFQASSFAQSPDMGGSTQSTGHSPFFTGSTSKPSYREGLSPLQTEPPSPPSSPIRSPFHPDKEETDASRVPPSRSPFELVQPQAAPEGSRSVSPQAPFGREPAKVSQESPFRSPFKRVPDSSSSQKGSPFSLPSQAAPSVSQSSQPQKQPLPPIISSPDLEKSPFSVARADIQSLTPQTGQKEISSNASSSSKSAEFRGIWITRFEWPSRDPVSAKQKILEYLDDAALHNYNAVIFQVRGQGDVLYPSPYEPWSQLIGGDDPGFDPLKFALEEAHARGLEFHAYVNAYPVWQGAEPPPHSEPEHPYWLYCQPDSDPCFACFDERGEIMKPNKTESDNYVFFSPGVPEVNAYLRKIVMDIVQRYDVDGIHFDRIRYPGTRYSHDPVSLSRFEGEGNPGGLSWEDWQRDQITRFLNDVYGQVASIKPHVKISVAGWGIYNKNRYEGYSGFSSGYHQYYQDTFAWLKKGVIDAIFPMIYWDIPDPKPNYGDLAKDFIDNAAGRHVYCSNWCNQVKMRPQEYKNQVELTRKLGGQGNVGFSVGGMKRRNLFSYFKDNIYQNPAANPDMPWKTNPTKGIIVGRVLRKDSGEPVADAHIKITGSEEIQLSGSDGFFAILNIEPGDPRITVTKIDLGETTSEPILVQPGQAAFIEIALGG